MKYVVSVKEVIDMCAVVEAESLQEAEALIHNAYCECMFDGNFGYTELEIEDKTQWYIDECGQEAYEKLTPEVNEFINEVDDWYNDDEDDEEVDK